MFFLYFTWTLFKYKWIYIYFLNLKIRLLTSKSSQAEEEDESQKGINKATKGGIVYGEYLQVISHRPLYMYWSKYELFIPNFEPV